MTKDDRIRELELVMIEILAYHKQAMVGAGLRSILDRAGKLINQQKAGDVPDELDTKIQDFRLYLFEKRLQALEKITGIKANDADDIPGR